jgi:hypothetical protein
MAPEDTKPSTCRAVFKPPGVPRMHPTVQRRVKIAIRSQLSTEPAELPGRIRTVGVGSSQLCRDRTLAALATVRLGLLGGFCTQ